MPAKSQAIQFYRPVLMLRPVVWWVICPHQVILCCALNGAKSMVKAQLVCGAHWLHLRHYRYRKLRIIILIRASHMFAMQMAIIAMNKTWFQSD